MDKQENVTILMVDDDPSKLLSYEAILRGLGENLVRASSGREALECLLKTDVAVILMDVNMPELDGFELAEIIRQHPRYQRTAIIFISAVHLTDVDRLKGYKHGAVDYIAVPVVPEILRAKVSAFADLHRKTRQLERLNHELEQRVAERTMEVLRREELITISLREKEVMLKEIHHRVKNNLQIISSLLDLQTDTVKDAHVLRILQESQHRIRSMALIHEKLYQSPDLAQVDLADYMRSLIAYLFRAYCGGEGLITLQTHIERVVLRMDTAVPCGLILNELVSNALKYAFPKGRAGEICVTLSEDKSGRVMLQVGDNGVGLPAGMDFRHASSLGLRLVNILTRQLEGTIDLHNTGGTTFRLSFPSV